MGRLDAFGPWAFAVLALVSTACGGSASGGGPVDGGGATGGAGGSGGGGGGVGGAGGTGGVVLKPTDKVDLLMMVDNSISMGDKQEILAQAVPRLIQRLAQPASGKPVTDLHIGLISSSLGGHGGNQCDTANPTFNPQQNDHAHLMPSVRSGLTSYQDLGFLWWDPTGKNGGETQLGQVTSDFATQISAVGESGCGYESSLEAWYRFLVDPSPPENVVVMDGTTATVQGPDATVLKQRQDFLRPDSAVVIAMLTDEDDCSTVDGGQNWIAAQTDQNGTPFYLPRATAACEKDPNDACCRSCAMAPTAGCPPPDTDPQCLQGPIWDAAGDHPNLRCWEQKRRFGLSFLYPTRKYVEALTQPTICAEWDGNGPKNCNGRVPNPLFVGNRSPGIVFLAGVVGVPWQDVATDATLADPSALELMDAKTLLAQARFDWFVPKCKSYVDTSELVVPLQICAVWDLTDQPDDPYMIESTEPRTGSNPATGSALVDPQGGVMQSAINGHEFDTQASDLEYACIFQLQTPRDCSTTTGACDCDDVFQGYTANNPLCQSPNGGYTKTQYFAKAYPGQRHLEVLKDLESQAVVASICPKSLSDPSSTAYGFNAAMDAVVKALSPVLGP